MALTHSAIVVRNLLGIFFVRHVQNETCCLNYLLPPKRDITAKLRNTRLFEISKQIQSDF